MTKKRDYDAEYKKYQSSPLAIKQRASRNRARALMIKKHGKAKLRGKDVDHKNGNPLDGRTSNLAITTVKYNRGKH